MIQACLTGDTEKVQTLINQRADVNRKTATGRFPLLVSREAAVIRLLLHSKANINQTTRNHLCSVRARVFEGNLGIVKLLVNAKASLHQKCNNKTPVEVACSTQNTPIVDYLLWEGAELHQNYPNIIEQVNSRRKLCIFPLTSRLLQVYVPQCITNLINQYLLASVICTNKKNNL